MFGLVLRGGWPRDPEVRDYALSLFSSAEQVTEFYDIVTEYRFGYLDALRSGTPIPLQQHVTAFTGPRTFDDMMSFAAQMEVQTEDALHYAYLRMAVDANPNLHPSLEKPHFWNAIRATPLDYLKEMLGTQRLGTPSMLSRMYKRGVPAEYVKRVPFFDDDDGYLAVYEAGVPPEYTLQFFLGRPESRHAKLRVSAQELIEFWKAGVALEFALSM